MHDCNTCPVRDHAACAALDPEQRSALARLGHHRRLKKGETVFHAGDDSVVCATLLTGALKIAECDSEGNEHIVSLVHPAGFVGELFAPISQYNVIAIADSELCVFSRTQHAEALANFPALATALLRRSNAELYEARSLMSLMGRNSAQARVAGLLLSLSSAASPSNCTPATHFDLPLSRAEMANLLGITIETVSRQISKFELAGLARRSGRRGMTIINRAALVQLVG